jgi:hypothetical protein
LANKGAKMRTELTREQLETIKVLFRDGCMKLYGIPYETGNPQTQMKRGDWLLLAGSGAARSFTARTKQRIIRFLSFVSVPGEPQTWTKVKRI